MQQYRKRGMPEWRGQSPQECLRIGKRIFNYLTSANTRKTKQEITVGMAFQIIVSTV